jgi:predicted Zn-dependent peptidase
MVAPSENHDDNCAAGILSYILGGDANSRLFKSVSQRKGLAYSIRSQHGNRNNAGGIYINGKIQSSRADEAIDAIFEEMKELQDTRVPEDELDRIKRSSIYDIAKAFETNSGHVDAIEMKSDRGITPESYLAKINAVTPELIQKAAQTYFPKDRENGKYVLMLRDPLKIE